MKTTMIFAALAAVLGSAGLGQQDEQKVPLGDVLKEALFAEEADRDLAKAEAGYREVLSRFDDERAYAATATLRLAEVLSARGEKEEAELLYARVLREFGDQEAVAEVARERLGDKVPEDKGESNLGRLQQMLEESPDLLDVAVSGMTPLARAAGAGELDVVNYLLERGASVEGGKLVHKRFGDGTVVWTPLGRAVTGGHLDVVERLLEKGATLPDGVLHTAVSVGNLAVTRRLLEAGADPNAKFGSSTIIYDPTITKLGTGVRVLNPPAGSEPKKFYTALEIAAEKGFLSVAKLLLDNGADFSDEISHPNALLSAVRSGNVELARLLLGHGADANGQSPIQVNFPTRATESLLHIAARNGASELVELLVDAGADIDAGGQFGYTALHVAQGAAVKVLLGAGADVHAKAEDGMTPIFNIVGETGAEKVQALVGAGADVNQISEAGYSPLLLAAERRSLPGARALVEAGADVKYVAKFGGVISCAVTRGDVAMIEFLASAGAEVDAVDEDGATALYRAVQYNKSEVVGALLGLRAKASGATGGLPPLAAIEVPDGVRSRSRTTPASTSAHDQSGKNFDEIVRALVDAGADLDVIDEKGRTALWKAANGKRFETLEYLLEKGATVEVGKQPAYEALNVNSTTDQVMVKKLKRASMFQSPDRDRQLLLTVEGQVFVQIDSDAVEGEEQPPCGHSLFEAYAFNAAAVSAEGMVKIWRRSVAKPIEIDLAKAWAAADPAGDVPLEWGDVVEFAATDDGKAVSVSDEAREKLDERLRRKVEFVWQREGVGDSPRREVTFSPGWQRAPTGQGWVLGGAKACDIVEGVKEIAVLPNLARLSWKDGEQTVRPVHWWIDRHTEEGKTVRFVIEGATWYQQLNPIPENGDVITLVGRFEPNPPQAKPRTSARRVVLPPPGR